MEENMKDLRVKKKYNSKDNIQVEEITILIILLISMGLLFIKTNSNIVNAVTLHKFLLKYHSFRNIVLNM